MDYLKIAQIANQCEVKRQQINEHYRMIGAHKFQVEVEVKFANAIHNMKVDLAKLENKLKKIVG